MTTKRVHPNWTKEEDKIVREAVYLAKKEGNTLRSAFEHASKEINRTVGSISFRWNNKLKHIHLKLTEPKETIKHEDIINYINDLKEQVDSYSILKQKYESLLLEHNTMRDKFSNISKIIS